MKMTRMILIAGLCATLCVSCAKKPAKEGGKAKIGDPAGSLEGLEFVKGGPVTIEKGKIYVIEFWATWCPPCKASIPHLTEVAAKVKDKGVQIVGITNEEPKIVKPFVEEQADKMNYVVAIDAGSKVGKAYMNAYGQGGIPTAFIVDKASKVVWFGHPMADMEDVLDQVIAGTFNAAAYANKKTEETAANEAKAAVAKAKIGDPAGSLEGLEFVKGGPVTLEKGKIYVVEFWATWCGPCKQSIPHLTEVAAKVKDKGVQIVGVSNEKLEVVKPFVEKQGDGMNYAVAIDAKATVWPAYMDAYQCRGIPTAFIVDAASQVVWNGHPMADMEEVLGQVIAGTFNAAAYAKKKADEEAQYKANVEAFKGYFAAVEADKADEAKAAADTLVEKAPAGMLNEMAWNILTKVAEAKRDKAVALRAAEKANGLTEGKDPMILDTYALALFQNDKAAEAIAAQEKAVGLVKGNEAMLADMKKRLEEFKAAGKI